MTTAGTISDVPFSCSHAGRIPMIRRHPAKLMRFFLSLAAAMLSLVLLYLGSFLWFRHHAVEFKLAHYSHPEHRLVFFSHVPQRQEFFRRLYWPLIRICPGDCYYPDYSETKAYVRFAEEEW